MKREKIYSKARLFLAILLIIAVLQICVFAQKAGPSASLPSTAPGAGFLTQQELSPAKDMLGQASADRTGPSTLLPQQKLLGASRAGWQKEQADWRLSAGSRIKSISYPQDKPPQTRAKMSKPAKPRRKQISPDPLRRIEFLTAGSVESVYASVIDSPPIDGFVPWIAVSVTDARADEFSLEPYDAVPEDSITGSDLAAHPESDYAIGIYDTGASAHVMGYDATTQAGLFNPPGYVTNNPVIISGVTGETEALVSQPIGIFICDIGAIEPNGLLWDRSSMMGQSNVAIAVGEGLDPVDLPTVIGSPMSVYYTAVFYNDTKITVTHNDINYTAPDMHIYQQDDPDIPNYANTIPLELRPLGASSVQYIFDPFDFEQLPISPSMLSVSLTPLQSIFFVASVDLYEGTHSAIDKTRFMLDTGAQISVVGSRIAARLAFNPANPDFEVEIQGITGDIITAPGFYIDSIDIPALGDWLSFTNIPVILLDIPSPEGGTVDGVIGMNLFADLNFVLRGGGLFLQDDPSIDYETISRLRGDIAPAGGDGVVDILDLAALANAWLANPLSQNWNSRADIVGDAIIDFRDFAALAQNWQ